MSLPLYSIAYQKRLLPFESAANSPHPFPFLLSPFPFYYINFRRTFIFFRYSTYRRSWYCVPTSPVFTWRLMALRDFSFYFFISNLVAVVLRFLGRGHSNFLFRDEKFSMCRLLWYLSPCMAAYVSMASAQLPTITNPYYFYSNINTAPIVAPQKISADEKAINSKTFTNYDDQSIQNTLNSHVVLLTTCLRDLKSKLYF